MLLQHIQTIVAFVVFFASTMFVSAAERPSVTSAPEFAKPWVWTPELESFFVSQSGGFLYNGRQFDRQRKANDLAKFVGDPNPDLNRLATLSLGFQLFTDQVSGKVVSDPNGVVKEFRGIASKYFLDGLAGDPDAEKTMKEDLFGANGVLTRASREQAVAEVLRVMDSSVDTEKTRIVKEMMKQVPTPILKIDDFKPRLHIHNHVMNGHLMDREGTLEITNNHGAPLHHCIVVCRFHPNLKRVEELAKEQWKADWKIYLLSQALVGPVDGQILQEVARWTGRRREQGSFLFIKEWEPGTKFELSLADFLTITSAPETAEFSIWSDEGRVVDFPLPVLKFRDSLFVDAGTAIAPPGEFLKAGSSDHLQQGSTWSGPVWIKGTLTPYKRSLVVTERTGNHFSGDLKSLDNRFYAIVGTIEDGVIRFESAPGEKPMVGSMVGHIDGSTIDLRFHSNQLDDVSRLEYQKPEPN